jgi:hypothetical protein
VARTTPRRRRPVAPHTLAILRIAFRYSYSRDAYVLRGLGNRMGPVLVPARDPGLSGHGA